MVLALALLNACSPAEAPSAVAPFPEQPAPEPQPAPSQAPPEDLLRRVEPIRAGETPFREEPSVRNELGEPNNESSANGLSPPLRRLFFQCTDDVSFAVRGAGAWLQVFPPGHSHGYIVLTAEPSASGLYYTTSGAELRMNGDLATLQVGRDRYVDCVSNPAAAVWDDPRRGGTPPR